MIALSLSNSSFNNSFSSILPQIIEIPLKRRIRLQKNKIINTLLEIIGQFGNDKHYTQSVPLITFENALKTSANKVTDTETNPKL